VGREDLALTLGIRSCTFDMVKNQNNQNRPYTLKFNYKLDTSYTKNRINAFYLPSSVL
jgi:hypothetical protein